MQDVDMNQTERNALVIQYMPYVHRYVRYKLNRRTRDSEYDDLVSIGYLALIRAMQTCKLDSALSEEVQTYRIKAYLFQSLRWYYGRHFARQPEASKANPIRVVSMTWDVAGKEAPEGSDFVLSDFLKPVAGYLSESDRLIINGKLAGDASEVIGTRLRVSPAIVSLRWFRLRQKLERWYDRGHFDSVKYLLTGVRRGT